jgi:hypothetical protein
MVVDQEISTTSSRGRATFREARRHALSLERLSHYFLEEGVPIEEGVEDDDLLLLRQRHQKRCTCRQSKCLYSVDRVEVYRRLKELWSVKTLKEHSTLVRSFLNECYMASQKKFVFELRSRVYKESTTVVPVCQTFFFKLFYINGSTFFEVYCAVCILVVDGY